jgi:hypothetical protein
MPYCYKTIGVMADIVRNHDLRDILDRHGCTRHPYDTAKWHTPRGILSVNGLKFMNWTTGAGGGGAIDLVMHLQDMSFKEAVIWLYTNSSSPLLDPPCRTSGLRLPPKDPSKLPRIIRYLTQERCLPLPLIEHLVETGKLYADSRSNAVFVLLGKKKCVVGAELRGTTGHRWRGMAPGSRRDKGCFYISGSSPGKMILCESAIDAVSCFTLYPEYTVASTSGAVAAPEWLLSVVKKGYELHCGFDTDDTGSRMSEKMMERYPSIKRLKPPAHDWNDALRQLKPQITHNR